MSVIQTRWCSLRGRMLALVAIACGGCSTAGGVIVDAEALGLDLSGRIERSDGTGIPGATITVHSGRYCDRDFFLSQQTTSGPGGQFSATLVSITGVPECMLVIGTAPGLLPDTLVFSRPAFKAAPNYGTLSVKLHLKLPL